MPRYEEIELRLGGRSVPMDSEEDLMRFHRYLDQRLKWLASFPSFFESQEEATRPQPPPHGANPKPVGSGTKAIVGRQMGERTIDYILGSLEVLGGHADMKVVIQTMQERGWVTASPDPQSVRTNVMATIKKHPGMVDVNGGILTLTPAGVNTLQNPGERLPANLHRPSEKADVLRPTDWVTRAGKKMTGPVTGAELYATMVEMGFVSTAKNPVEAVKTIMRANPLFRRFGVTPAGAMLWEYHPTESDEETTPAATAATLFTSPETDN